MQDNTYTQDEVAAILRVSRASVRRAVEQKLLTPVYGGLMGNRVVGITKESVNTFLDYRKTVQAQNAKGKGASHVKKTAAVR